MNVLNRADYLIEENRKLYKKLDKIAKWQRETIKRTKKEFRETQSAMIITEITISKLEDIAQTMHGKILLAPKLLIKKKDEEAKS